nr:PREDICTED: uncharacterized protein LOC105662071 [Megachile rotundata]
MQSVIEHLQTEYDNIPITGVLLVYPDYYVHVLEASEEIIYKHFKILYESDNVDPEFGGSVFLPFYPHVHQRFFTQWFHVFTIPPSLFDIPKSYEVEDIQKQMSNCLKKVYRFCDYITNIDRDYSIPMKDVVNNLGEQLLRVLPESTLIEYLLNAKSHVLLTVENYLNIHCTIPFINLYQGNTSFFNCTFLQGLASS